MIFVDRSAVPEPAVLATVGRQEYEKALEFYDIPIERRRQRKFPFAIYATRMCGAR